MGHGRRGMLAGSILVACAVASCGGSAVEPPSDDFGAACTAVRARARAAAETGVRLKREQSTDVAAISASATDYVTAVRSRPECFSDGQKANAERVASALPTPPAPS